MRILLLTETLCAGGAEIFVVRLANALVRVGIAAAVTVPAHRSIAEHGRRLEASIRGAGFTPLRLDLAQDSGFAAACIPLGVGLPRRRDTR